MSSAGVRILLDEPIGTINPNIHGHFIEHLGRCVDEGIWVGPDSAIPNRDGIRSDVAEALGELGLEVLRWPGGCFADQYDWRDGIGPREQRPRRRNIWWGKEEDNAFGTHEFMALCEMVNASAYICGNVGSGTPREMMEWLEYCTYDGDTTLSRLRAENGRPEPFDIAFWGIGNENWGCGGNMSPEQYARLFRLFETYLQPRAEGLQTIACGLDHGWNHRLLDELGCTRRLDLLSIHHYYKAGHSTEFTEQEYYRLMAEALKLEARIIRDTHLIRFFEGDSPGRVGLAIDEWGVWHPDAEQPGLYQRNTLRDALSAAILLDVFNRHADSVQMANIAQTINVLQALIQTDGARMWRTPTYWAYMLHKPHRGRCALRSVLECEQMGPVDGRSLPLVSVSASRRDDGVFLTMTNLHLSEAVEIEVQVVDGRLADAVGDMLTADAANATNDAGESDRVRLAEAYPRAAGGSIVCELPPVSAVAVDARLY